MGEQLVTQWCWQLLGRAPSPADLANAAAIDAGQLTPQGVLAGTVACDEFWNRCGKNLSAWIGMLFREIAHQPLTEADLLYWQQVLWNNGGLGFNPGRLQTAEVFIGQYYPQFTAQARPVLPDPSDVASLRSYELGSIQSILTGWVTARMLSQTDKDVLSAMYSAVQEDDAVTDAFLVKVVGKLAK